MITYAGMGLNLIFFMEFVNLMLPNRLAVSWKNLFVFGNNYLMTKKILNDEHVLSLQLRENTYFTVDNYLQRQINFSS